MAAPPEIRLSAALSVEIQPSGVAFDAAPGELLMEAANRAGLYWPTLCGGEARCLACIFVPADPASLAPAEDVEREALAKAGRTPERFRLACQARLQGDLVATHRGVRAARPGDRLPFLAP